jgi:1-acyl-sn-glycerol-3-phosphate acyltransferase
VSTEAEMRPDGSAKSKPVDWDRGRPLEDHLTPLISTAALIARGLSQSITRVKVVGDFEAIPREGPVIVASNHVSNADPVIIGAWLTKRVGRRIHWLGKREMFDWPVVGWMARNGGVVPVERSGADVEAFRQAKRVLDEGHLLMIFPEGTRSPNGELQRPKDGLAVLALQANAPIVPVGMADTDRVWPRGQKLPRPGGHATMTVGAPFVLADELPPNLDRKARKSAGTDLIMRRIAALLPERQRGVYGIPPPDLPATPDQEA